MIDIIVDTINNASHKTDPKFIFTGKVPCHLIKCLKIFKTGFYTARPFHNIHGYHKSYCRKNHRGEHTNFYKQQAVILPEHSHQGSQQEGRYPEVGLNNSILERWHSFKVKLMSVKAYLQKSLYGFLVNRLLRNLLSFHAFSISKGSVFVKFRTDRMSGWSNPTIELNSSKGVIEK